MTDETTPKVELTEEQRNAIEEHKKDTANHERMLYELGDPKRAVRLIMLTEDLTTILLQLNHNLAVLLQDLRKWREEDKTSRLVMP